MKTVILVAYSTSGKTRQVLFDFDGQEVSVLLPPCYGDDGACRSYEATIEKSLKDLLMNQGFKVERLSGPFKSVSVRLGLGKYGRNNLIYVEGFGSYIRLAGFLTDAKFTLEDYPDAGSSVRTLENCEKCRKCGTSCPTHAIGDDRFLLRVDRCLAYQNEKFEAWPDYVKTARNACLVGCLICQNVCPLNKAFTTVETVSSERFNQEETRYILGLGENVDQELIDSINSKIDGLGLSRHKEYFVRNIRGYINNAGQ